ncbi:MAG: MarR family transcriptional regulator [Bacteroidetes bacterium]|nr:MarR family transcriptional regulator [Bacteroidota bacterium]
MTAYNKYDSIGFLLYNTARAMSCFFNQTLKEHGYELTVEHWGILINLAEQDGNTQTGLCGCIGKDKTYMTRLLDQLEKDKMVERRSDNQDRRNKKIYLTEKGKEIQNELVFVVKENILAEASKDFSSQELETLKFLLKKLHQNINPKN